MHLPQAQYQEDERAEVRQFIPDGPSSFLDVGCATGGFGRGLRRRYPRARIVGIEAVPAAAASARANGYDAVLDGYFPSSVPHDQKFDCIIFNDVLEHMFDPWEAIEAAKSLLSDDGFIVASIPNIRYFPVVVDLVRRDRWDYAEWGVLDRTHVRFFTRTTMMEMLEQAGLTVIAVHGINSAFSLAKWKKFSLFSRCVGHAQWMQFVVIAGTPKR